LVYSAFSNLHTKGQNFERVSNPDRLIERNHVNHNCQCP